MQVGAHVVGSRKVRAFKKRLRDLERILGKKIMEAEIIRAARMIVPGI